MTVLDQYLTTRQFLFQQAGINPESKYQSLNGPVKKVHYLELGSGNPLIIIHGGLSHSSEWIPILGQLSKQYKLYVVDRPGHGLTEAIDYSNVDYRQSAIEFLTNFMDAIRIQNASILANSIGGYFSIAYAMAHPDRVNKLILIGAPAGLNRHIPFMLRMLGVKGINKFIFKTAAKPSIKGLRNIHKQLLVKDIDKISDDYLQHCVCHMLLPGVEKSIRTMLENVLDLGGWRKKYLLTGELSSLRIPVGLIWGDSDKFESAEAGKKKAEKIRNYKFEVVHNAGHCPWVDEPERCSDLILQMLDEQ